MTTQRDLYMQAIAKALPPEHKDKIPKYVDRMDTHFNSMLSLVEAAYEDLELPQPLRIGCVRRMITGIATVIFFTEGINALMDSAKIIAQNIQMELIERKKQAVDKSKGDGDAKK